MFIVKGTNSYQDLKENKIFFSLFIHSPDPAVRGRPISYQDFKPC